MDHAWPDCPPREFHKDRKNNPSSYEAQPNVVHVVSADEPSALSPEGNTKKLERRPYDEPHSLSRIPPYHHEAHRRNRPQNAASEGANSMSDQVNRIDINNETFRTTTNKRTPAHFADDAAQRSKRTTSGAIERGLSSVSQTHENSSPASGLRPNPRHAESTMQPGTSLPDPRVSKGLPLPSPPGLADQSSRDGQRSSFPLSSGARNLSAQALGLNDRQTGGSPPSSPVNTDNDQDGAILLQPETRPITQEQLVNEVKGIYAGLVMVEKKCVEIDQQQAATTNKLTNEQWQALIALHRTLLHEHHDFFLASQHPSSSPALKRLATKYAMPARMWRHGIHSFLELLRHRLPDSLDHMLSFVYLAYSMMALLMESVPSFEETWIECLGDLARYRMAIEEVDMRDREVWAGVARMWYDKAADKSPNVGRIQHHLAVLARPNIVQQLFYYSKALVSVNPFPNARESVMLLFNPFLTNGEIASQRYPLVESSFVKAAAIHFTRGSVRMYNQLMEQFVSALNSHIGRVTAKFRVQGPEIASTLCAALFDFGNVESFLWKAFAAYDSQLQAALDSLKATTGQTTAIAEQEAKLKAEQRSVNFRSLNGHSGNAKAAHSTRDSTTKDATFSGAQDAVAHACQLFYFSSEVVFSRVGDKNILPFAHTVLAFLNSLAHVPEALLFVEGQVPWESIVTFLNTLGRSGAVESRFEGSAFPQPLSGTGRQLPEDFIMRGLVWAKHYFPSEFFEGQVVDEDERTLELPSHAAPRAERCLWLGIQLAALGRWITYDSQTKQFSATDFAQGLESDRAYTFDSRSPTMSVEREDTYMIDVKS